MDNSGLYKIFNNHRASFHFLLTCRGLMHRRAFLGANAENPKSLVSWIAYRFLDFQFYQMIAYKY